MFPKPSLRMEVLSLIPIAFLIIFGIAVGTENIKNTAEASHCTQHITVLYLTDKNDTSKIEDFLNTHNVAEVDYERPGYANYYAEPEIMVRWLECHSP